MRRPVAFKSVTLGTALSTAISITSTIFITLTPGDIVQAQALEEIVVTAQRREQSLQEVPLSIEAFSGAELEQQGFRNMEDLSVFSPSVQIDGSSVQDQTVRVRGFGTTGNSLTLEQAVPVFVDGIHFGRQSMIKTAFLDTAQVEVLKGPQPVFFGMNATAGAFNLRSRMPGDVWEGNIITEIGNNGQQKLSVATGGPINDTWGIRVAGIKESNDGYARHFITGERVPKSDHLGGRTILQWTPTERFQATAKVEYSRQRNGSDVAFYCLTGDSLIYQGANPSATQRSIDGVVIEDEGASQTLWDDPPNGVGWDVPFIEDVDRYPDCFDSKMGFYSGGPYLEPPINYAGEDSTTGALDIREAAEAFVKIEGDYTAGQGYGGDSNSTLAGHDDIDLKQYYLDLNYDLANGIGINSKTAYVDFYRDPVRDNANSGILENPQARIEDFTQWSTELRFTSPDGGHDIGSYNIEWMTGFFWQLTTKDHTSNSFRNNVRQGQRFNWLWEDATWTTAFATLTFNFMGDKASIDFGGRISRVKKDVFVKGYGASWVYDVRPCAPHPDDNIGGGNSDPDTCALHPDAVQLDFEADHPRILVPGADLTNLWYIPYEASRNTPSSWRGNRASAVGLTAASFSAREDSGPITDGFSTTEFDPQVTLRYRPNENHSLFFRWAEANKAAGYDTGQTSIPNPIDQMKFDAEYSETFELGSKGMLWDNRVRYDVALFRTVFRDLQLSGAAPTFSDQNSQSLNAGKQQVQGIEFGLSVAATDRLIVGLQGAIMDAQLKEFYGVGCSFAEFVNTRDNLGIPGIWPCTDLENEVKDESGRQPSGTEDWKFVSTLDYTIPVFDNYEVSANVKGYLTSGEREGSSFDFVYGDMNASLSFGDQEGVWEVMVYGRNLLEPRPKFHPERLVPGSESGFTSMGESTSSNLFKKYGMQFRYNFL